MRNESRPIIAAAGTAIGALMLASPSHAAVTVGTLACNVGGGPGFIIASSRPLSCTFNGPAGPEHYSGNVTKFGMDIGYLSGGEIVWDVVAPSPAPAPGMLAGSYAGVTGSAAVGVGAGANVLVGGSSRSFTLQPVSVEGETGLDVAAGVEAMNLQYRPPAGPPPSPVPPRG